MNSSLMKTSFNEQSLTLSPLYYFDIPKLFRQFIKTVPALSSIFSGVPYPLKTRRRTLSVSPYGSWIIWTWSRHSPINNHQRDLEIRNDSHSFNDELVIAWTFYVVTNSFCLAIYYLSGIRSSVSTIPSSIPLPTSTLYSFRDMTFLWPSHVLASDINVISPRGPRVYLSVIWMDKYHSWSTRLN